MNGITPLNLLLLIIGAVLIMSGINNKSPKDTVTEIVGQVRTRASGGGNPRKPQDIS